VWYNSTSATLKVRAATTSGTFSTGGNMNTGRQLLGSAGTATAALGFGGSPYTGATESYNGSAWTTVPGTLNTPRGYIAGCGTQTAALGATGYGPGAGSFPASAETYNGTSWTSISPVTTGRALPGISGIQTAALIFGGSSPFSTIRVISESWNGTSWTSAPSINTARFRIGSSGTQTAALGFGGSPGSPPYNTTATESYNGTSWTTVNSLPTAVRPFTGNGVMTQTAAISTGGYPSSARTDIWNGTSWTANPTSLSTNRGGGAQAGSASSGLSFGGYTGAYSVATELWTGPGVGQTKTVTVT
jgi:hypothetical protein